MTTMKEGKSRLLMGMGKVLVDTNGAE